MNKELIKTYFKEFEHWLNDGKLLHKDEFGNWENTRDIWDLRTERIKAVVINDEYVEFRKAMAEGKTVQNHDYFSKQWFDMKTPDFHGASDTRYAGVYRIKPERHKFKVGDWVIHNGVVKRVTKAIDGYIDSLDNEVAVIMKEESLELWEPQVGEWCWVFNYLRDVPNLRKVIKVEDNFKNRFDDENFTKAVRVSRGYDLSDEVGYRFCEPFIGQLPTSIKDYKKG